MKFVVDYRGPDGSHQQKEIEADDRAAVFSELKKLGISAIAVREGAMTKKAKTAKGPSKPLPPSVLRGVFAGVIVIVLVVALFFVFGNRDVKTQERAAEKSKLIKEVTPAALKPPSALVETNAVPVTAETYDKGLGDDWETIQRVKKEGGQYVDAQGKRHRVKVAKTIFDHNTDSILCAVLCAGTQEIMLPPFDGNEDREFLKSLETPIVIMNDDPDDVKQKKLLVRAARKEVKDMMDQGHSFQSIIQSHRADMDLQRESVAQAVEGLREYLDKGDEEGAELYIEAMNPVLEKMGATPLHMPTGENRPHLKRKGN